MRRRNVASKTTGSTERRAGARAVGPDEFKHELLKFSRREGKPLTIVGVRVTNIDTVASLTDSEAMDRLSRAIRSTIAGCVEPSNIFTSLAPSRILILTFDDAPWHDGLKRRLSELNMPGWTIKPTFETQAQRVEADDAETALDALGCEIDEHGVLCPRTERKLFSTLGSREKWLERYDGAPPRVRDRWRNVGCRLLTIRTEELCCPVDELLKRAKALQDADHPSIEPLRDFWCDEDGFIGVSDEAVGKTLDQWLQSHREDDATRKELVQQYISILLYGRSLTPPMVLSGLSEHLRVSAVDSHLRLGDCFQLDVLRRDEHQVSEADIVHDVEAFADRLGVRLPEGRSTLNKLRAAFKDA